MIGCGLAHKVRAWLANALLLATVILCSTGSTGWCQLAADQPAPTFALKDLEGRLHDLARTQDKDWVILFFCDLDSVSNRRGLARINGLVETIRDRKIQAFAVTRSPVETVRDVVKEIPVAFPLLLDDSGVTDLYHSHLILPSVYILKNGRTVSKAILGGGQSMEIQITQFLEQARLEHKNTELSSAPPGRSSGDETTGTTPESHPQAPSRTSTLPPYPIRKSVEPPDEKARKLFHLAREENSRLTWDDCLASKALQRAQSLHEKGVMEHKDPATGKNPAFEMVKSCAQRAAYAGENLSRSVGTSSRTIHQEFMESSTHRQNIQNRKYSRMGVGCYETICVELFVGF